MYFQSIDDKRECIGIYYDGKLIFDKEQMPPIGAGMRTWKYSGSILSNEVEYGWLRSEGANLEESCPPELFDELQRLQKKMHAFRKAFEIAKIDFRQNCFFDLVPHDFLHEFLEIKNQITQHVFENRKEPPIYPHLCSLEKLLYKIRYQPLNINNEGCRSLFSQSVHRHRANKILNGSPFIDYNIFGTKTGRLATYAGSFPILTMAKELRALIKPRNDWFVSLDYNGAEVRTVIKLMGEDQPPEDVHTWHMNTLLKGKSTISRDEAKTAFFSWLYNPSSNQLEDSFYDRELLLKNHYVGGKIETPFGRQIEVDEFRAVNYLVQSTTADLVNDRAVEIDKLLQDKKSFISHIVHDEIVLDIADEERYIIPDIKEVFANNKLDTFLVSCKAGKDAHNLSELNI